MNIIEIAANLLVRYHKIGQMEQYYKLMYLHYIISMYV